MRTIRRQDLYFPYCPAGLDRAIVFYFVLVVCLLQNGAQGYGTRYTAALRKETEHLFFHGYENYMRHAFPEDELKPLTCEPLTRDKTDPTRIDLNDALGNYSLTLIDSLSTLAVLASSPTSDVGNKPLLLFQDGIRDLVEQYGDGTNGTLGTGLRARAFDLDSKVQVFETVIRGVGGLLSAHLFAVGDLPIRGYTVSETDATYARQWHKGKEEGVAKGITWQNGLVYDGQLLRLAYDLGQRMIPAFWTSTGLPYPRVNLRHGIPFYARSPHNYNPTEGQCDAQASQSEEVTETCSAGAGSLVLEFTVLSRLTGDGRFEELAKRAFWSVWHRRSNIDLIGAGIDAETGNWIGTLTGIGAGIDSFFEYAYKSHILLQNNYHPRYDTLAQKPDPRILFEPLTDYEKSSDAFLHVWETSHAAIRRHVMRGPNFQHSHYIQADLNTGAARAVWMDALSAYYPGLLTMAGHVEEAIQAHLLTTALWTRFSALPERWNLMTGGIEGGLGWWIGRPEFIESNYYLYRATEDPWYKYVAEMVLSDIKRRCWTECGWTGIQNVLTGEKSNRMESFFLGETAKYLFLTFDDDHPLNRLDAPFVFSTEGHPLIIPSTVNAVGTGKQFPMSSKVNQATCPARPPAVALSVSSTAARGDIYHAAALARLPFQPTKKTKVGSIHAEYAADHPSIAMSDVISPSNFTYYPWTLPLGLVPSQAFSSPMRSHTTLELTFPSASTAGQPVIPLSKVTDGISINSLSGLKISLIQDVPMMQDGEILEGYRINYINGFGLGKDEKVYIAHDRGFGNMNPADPHFTRVRDSQMLDLVLESGHHRNTSSNHATGADRQFNVDHDDTEQSTVGAALSSFISQLASLVQDSQHSAFPNLRRDSRRQGTSNVNHVALAAIISTGRGAAAIPDWPEVSGPGKPGQLPWTSIYATDQLCHHKLPQSVPKNHHVIVIKRGGCSFSQKLANIPLFMPSIRSLQLVVIVDFEADDATIDTADITVRPLLEDVQKTSHGLVRPHPIPMVMATGAQETYQALSHARGIGVKRRYSVRSQGVPITNLIVT